MIWWWTSAAWAHRPGLSYARVEGGELALTFAEPELAARFPVSDLDAAAWLLADATIGRATVSSGGAPCALGEAAVARVEADGIEIRAPLSCPPGDWTLHAAYLRDFEPGHRQYLEADGAAVAVLDATQDTATFAGAASDGAVALRFAGLGVEHIWTGYDHLAFLLALLLTATKLRQMLTIVTGFTVAHSITLSLAATGVFTLSPALVEPAIAASIVFVGLENLLRPPPERRVVITFLLGLVHGFGFAGMLAELGLPRHALGLALVSFNVGVEAGQAVVVLAALPLLVRLGARPWWDARVMPAASLGIAALGLYWLLERVFGS